MVKTYVSLFYVQYFTSVNVKGKEVSIEFLGGNAGFNPPIRGKYTTQDEDIQEAIENDYRYGVQFKYLPAKKKTERMLSRTERARLERARAKAEMQAEKEQSNLTIVPEPINAQQGKNHLMQRFPEFTHRDLPNKAAILAAAEAKNISFPNIPL